MRHIAAIFALIALPALAGPQPPVQAEGIARLDWGVFCAGQAMGRVVAPSTQAGWIHAPRDEIVFGWPEQQVVPATLGLAFGVKVTGQQGWETAVGEARVYRPGRSTPDIWASDITAHAATAAFFRFDQGSELVPGTWVIEGWDRDTRLYRVEFQVVPAEAAPGIAQACGAIS